mmetsp:Transcript_17639/g.29325  ORF Transcript_17639/g.29325 Transcript_17639/m.29325 type:complete len:163 (+) Transcript_17639:141-629(+)
MSTRSPNDFEAPPNMDDFLGGPNREQRSAEMHASLMQWLTESDDMRKTAKSSLKQSLYAGGGAFAGSFLGGPVGGLIGGVAGSLVGFLKSDDYDGLLLAVSKIDDAHRTKLLKEVATVLMVAGAQMKQLNSAAGLKEQLNRFVNQEQVRDGVWKACMKSMNE